MMRFTIEILSVFVNFDNYAVVPGVRRNAPQPSNWSAENGLTHNALAFINGQRHVSQLRIHLLDLFSERVGDMTPTRCAVASGVGWRLN
jgi:hypothetical protein